MAFFGALGELGDECALNFLEAVEEQAFPQEVRSEIVIAKRNARMKQKQG